MPGLGAVWTRARPALRTRQTTMTDSRYQAFRCALQNEPVVSLSEERIIDGQTAMGMLSHLQEQQPLYALERFGDGATVMALDPYLTMTCDDQRTRITCDGQAHIGPAATAQEGLATLRARFVSNSGPSHPAAGIFGMVAVEGLARWMVPQAVVVLHPDNRDRVTVVRHVFAESVTGDVRVAYDHAVRQLRRLVTWLSAPTYVKPLSVQAPAAVMHQDDLGRATPLHVYRYLRQLVPAKTACFVHEDGFHLLGADLQPALTSPHVLQAQLRISTDHSAPGEPAYAVFHASFDGTFFGTRPAGALRIDHAPAQGAVRPRALPIGKAAAPYREAMLLADGDAL